MQESALHPAHTLHEEYQAASRLLEVLKQEQDHLIGADVDALLSLTEEKAQLVARMTVLAQQRHESLRSAGYEAGEAGMQAWAESPAAGEASAGLWRDLLAAARTARETNRTNGLLIGQHLANNQKALHILQGSPSTGGVYGPNGQTAMRTSSRKLVIG